MRRPARIDLSAPPGPGSLTLALLLLALAPAPEPPLPPAAGGAPLGVRELPAQTPGGTGSPDALRAEFERFESQLDGGRLGVGVLHLESGRSLFYRGDERFPMASTYKVPIATRLLERVDRGEMSLDSMVTVEQGHLHPGSGVLEELLDDPGVVLSVRNLMELMLLISDNSATDICLRLAGGPTEVNRKMSELGVEDLRVDRPTVELIADYYGVENLPPTDEITPERWEQLRERASGEQREAAREAFNRDPRDTSTPRAMATLLERVWRGEALSDTSTAVLKDVLGRVQTGTSRLKGMLDDSITVSHKTGTIGGTLNDVGVLELPDGAGHVVTAVFTKESELDREERAEVVAHVARAVYDYFRFNRAQTETAGGDSP